MPPKSSKKGHNPPRVFKLFGDFIRASKDIGSETKRAVDVYDAVIKKHWSKYAAALEDAAAKKPEKKKRKVDPVKTLGKAMDVVAEKLVTVKTESPTEFETLKHSVQEVIPESMKEIMDGGTSGVECPNCHHVIDAIATPAQPNQE